MLYQDPMVEDPILEKFTMQIEVKAKKKQNMQICSGTGKVISHP
jgi:hypothetical protein